MAEITPSYKVEVETPDEAFKLTISESSGYSQKEAERVAEEFRGLAETSPDIRIVETVSKT